MKKIIRFFTITVLFLPMIVRAESSVVPFTLEDRDRIIRTEQRLEALDAKIDAKTEGLRSEMTAQFKAIDQRFESIDKRFDQLFDFLWAIIGIFTTMLVSVFGFAFWDRKLSLQPLKKENEKTVTILRDFSTHQPKLKEILKNAGLM